MSDKRLGGSTDGGFEVMRPGILQPKFLVYRECPCGDWLCTDEGARAPRCSSCEGFFVPGGTGLVDGEPIFGADPVEQRRMRGLAFVGFLTSETGALSLVQRVKGLLGLFGDRHEATYASTLALERVQPYFYPREIQAASDAIGQASDES